jgi:catechol 2,3-dioxygenase-like lactoylglutathione lyase family enzyme
MPLAHIEHLAVLVEDLEETCDWFVDNLGMTRGHTPDFRIPVQWLYIGDRDALHIAQKPNEDRAKRFQDRYLGGAMSEETSGTGIIDHVAFHCTGLPAMMAQLDDNGVDYLRRQANDGDLYQLFIKGPNGMRIELNFDAAEAEAAGIKPDMDAKQAVAEAEPAVG